MAGMSKLAGGAKALEAHEQGMADRVLAAGEAGLLGDRDARRRYFAHRGKVCGDLAKRMREHKGDKRMADMAQVLALAWRDNDFQTAARAALALAELMPVVFVLPPEER